MRANKLETVLSKDCLACLAPLDMCFHVSTQWAFGVTVWELFTCGSVPYSGISIMSVLKAIKAGQRLEKPENAACSNEMLVAKF